MKKWMVRAYAKINLGLRVLGRRADGYHELDTYFLQISLADQLFFEKSEEAYLEFACNWPEIPVDRDNLCVRAYDLITRKAGRKPGVKLYLHKNVPAGGGLGGGSSDAAVALMAINQICGLELAQEDLRELALELGSDVPFFLEGGFCRGQGRGEILSPVPRLPEIGIVVIVPEFSISTASVYKNIKLGLTKSHQNCTFALSKLQCFEDCNTESLGVNDLEEIVFQWHPHLLAVKNKLGQEGAIFSNLTGSGAAVFGVFSSLSQAQAVQQLFRSEYRTFSARPMKWGYGDVDSFLR